MTRAISGGFDMVAELAVDAIDGWAREHLPTEVDRTWSIDVALWRLVDWKISTRLHVAVAHAQLEAGIGGAPPGITWGVSADGSQMCTDALQVLGREISPADCHPVLPTVTLRADIVAAGRRLSLENVSAQIALPPGCLEAIPGVTAYLATFDIIPGGATREEKRIELYAMVESGLAAAINALLPNSIPLLPLPVQSVTLAVVGQELRVMMNIDAVANPVSDPRAITRSALRRPATSGAGPSDLAALVVGNDWLLRNSVRPALERGLGLPALGFCEPHPCFWMGAQLLTNHFDMRVDLTQVKAEIDSAGNARISASVGARHSTGAFGLTGSAQMGIAVSLGADHKLRAAVAEPEVGALDVWIAEWVYVLACFVPGDPLVLLALGLVDACAGGDAAAVINAALKGKVSIPDLELSVPSVAGLHFDLSMAQADAEPQLANLPLGPFPIPVPVSRANDVVVQVYSGP